jgi:hypothetical protein
MDEPATVRKRPGKSDSTNCPYVPFPCMIFTASVGLNQWLAVLSFVFSASQVLGTLCGQLDHGK